MEREVGAEDTIAQESQALGVANRLREMLDRYGILRADVDVAVAGPDGVGADEHALDDSVGVALAHPTVHERPGIALVGVADQVFRLAGGVAAELPLPPRGKARAPAPAKATGRDLGNDILGGHSTEDFGQRIVAVERQIILD